MSRNLAAMRADSNQLTKVCRYRDVPEGGAVRVEIDDTPVAVVRSGDNLYAISDRCSHAEVPLSEGEIDNDTVECWLHGSCFDLRTGQPVNPPAVEPIATYRVTVEDGDVFVSLDSDD
jgi:3-phenylpropionate/trans-cinnamate dioxygenase ferredoxin subunit